MRVLVTGSTGFVGSHLCEYALKQGADVWGVRRWRSSMENVEHLRNRVHFINGDLTDPSAVRKILEESKPDWIFHLAAQSFVKCSFEQPRETLHTNIMCEINLLHGLREKLAGAMVVAGSSEEYGKVLTTEIPIKENHPLRPLSPYAVSKVAQDLLAYQYHQSYGVHVVRARAFNHEGPRRDEVFVTSSFAKQIAEIELGLKEPVVHVGNLAAIRDFTDVRDTVRAYWLLLEKGDPGDVYNIASAEADGLWKFNPDVAQGECLYGAWKISDVLDYLGQISTHHHFRIETDPARMRPSDVPILVGDFTKLLNKTGWQPTIPFKRTLEDMLIYWRERIRRNMEVPGAPLGVLR